MCECNQDSGGIPFICKEHQTPDDETLVDALVMQDIAQCMRKTTILMPIKNHSSFATTLLWQIFEASTAMFKSWADVEKLNDDDIEYIFKRSFPVFIKEYPDVLILDA